MVAHLLSHITAYVIISPLFIAADRTLFRTHGGLSMMTDHNTLCR